MIKFERIDFDNMENHGPEYISQTMYFKDRQSLDKWLESYKTGFYLGYWDLKPYPRFEVKNVDDPL